MQKKSNIKIRVNRCCNNNNNNNNNNTTTTTTTTTNNNNNNNNKEKEKRKRRRNGRMDEWNRRVDLILSYLSKYCTYSISY